MPNKMARVVDGGFAYRASEMINPSSPPVDFSNAREFSTKSIGSCHITSAI